MKTGDAKPFLMLGLGGEIFAIDAECVREILDPVPVTDVPGARDFVHGLINVRGKVAPLVDFRLRFGMEAAPATPDTRFIVLEVKLGQDTTFAGVIAEKVHEVAELSFSSLGPAPKIGMRWRPEFVKAIGQWRDGFVVVPNIDAILN